MWHLVLVAEVYFAEFRFDFDLSRITLLLKQEIPKSMSYHS